MSGKGCVEHRGMVSFSPLKIFNEISFVCFILTAITVGGCASYQPKPLTSEAVHANMVPPDMETIRVQAKTIRHPLLKPIPFDDRNGLSPDEAAILAVLANPSLRAVRDQRGIAEAQLLQAGILPNPRFSADFANLVGGDTQGAVNAYGFGLDWDIKPLISRKARLGASEAHADSVDLQVAWQEWQVAEAAKLHVYHLTTAKRRFSAVQQAEAAFQQSWKRTRQGVELGTKTALDFSTAESSLQEARSGLLRARLDIEKKRLALNRILGFPAEKIVALEKSVPIPFLKAIPPADQLEADIEERRLDLLALRQGYQSQEARVRAAVRSQFPKITLGLAGKRETENVQTVGAGISIDLPIFDRNQGRIAEERATRKQLFDEYTARLFEARADIATIETETRATQKQIAVIDELLSALKKLTINYRKAADTGEVEVLSYFKVLGSFHKKQIQKIELEQKMIDLGIALEIASGRYGLVNGESARAAHEPATDKNASK